MSPKVTSYTAPWLSNGSPGAALFSAPTQPSPVRPSALSPPKKPQPGPRRTIARRGTEVFVAVGKEIRWGDLAWLKEKYEESPAAVLDGIKRETSDVAFEDVADSPRSASGLRIIKTPVADDIRQLIISPNSTYLAILTTHTVHICLIPDSSHLSSADQSIIKPKVWTLGPTTHVTSRPSIASALWHPLGVNGSCIVTVTTDAVVRLWELSLKDRWSFDAPTLSIDLKKLVDGTTLDQDYTASIAASNSSGYFSMDSVEMEVAAAAFASRGSGEWSPMTLWVAMREGDLYALCPLLPQKWAPPPTLIPSLSVSIVAKVATLEDDTGASAQAKLLAQNQLEWMSEIDNQESSIVDSLPGEPLAEVYTRPSRPGTVPRLQGPFSLKANPTIVDELDGELTDILVIGKKVDTDDLMTGEEEENVDLGDGNQEGLSLNVICLLSTSGQVRVYLDLEGVEAQWLPPKRKSKHALPLAQSDSTTLLTFQILDTMTPIEVAEDAWPLFSLDHMSRYNFFVTHHAGITFVSLSSWVFRLESDLQGDSDAGSDFRLGLLANSESTRDRLYTRAAADTALSLTASSVIRDPDVGYFLLSATPYEPIALTFDDPEFDTYSHPRESTPRYEETPARLLEFYEPRPAFKPSHVLDQASELPTLLARLKTSRHKCIVNQEVRLSPVTLQIFTDAHRVLSDETYQTGKAASEVFRRCILLQSEMKHQITAVNEVKSKIDKIAGRDDDSGGESDEARFERRIEEAKDRQGRIGLRLEKMRALVAKGSTRELSDRERALAGEVGSLEANVFGTPVKQGEASTQDSASLAKRLEEVKRLKEELVAEARRAMRREGKEGDVTGNDVAPRSPRMGGDLRVPSEIRKAKMQQVRNLLDRETALVEAISSRLERLTG